MNLADKIIELRKKKGWSQEQLAEKMNVSRQAVSKWESAQALPDLDKILLIGSLFDVTTDYLLKDEIDEIIDKDNIADAKQLKQQIKNSVIAAYSGLLVVVYFVWSILSHNWHITWVTFVAGGVLFPVLDAICNYFVNK